MKITAAKIEGFGVWHDLKLDNLSGKLTAFYGANEAGKTTLMQFVRSVMYGVSPTRRERYLPPRFGGRPGGSLGIVDGDVSFQLTRIADRGPDDLGLATIEMANGQAGGDRLLREALSDVDEATFNNIFAIGLSEIQELNSLNGIEAAQAIYRLTSGVDRVSLYDVIQNLRQTRRELLWGKDTSSKILQLVSRREQLLGEIQQLSQQSRNWSQLAVRIKELDAEIAAKEVELRDCEYRARTVEIAVGIKPNWLKRLKLTNQLEQFAGTIQLPDDAIQRLDELGRKIEKHQREAAILEGQRRQLREESEQLGINEPLLKCACRIDALGEQRDWLLSLERQMEDIQTEAEEFEERLESEQERLGAALGLADQNTLKEITSADIEGLQPHIKEIRSAQKQVDQAESDLDTLTENERSLKVKIESAVIGGEHHGLPMDAREASDLVAKLRKRLQVEQRLDQARSHEIDMEQQSHDLLDDQVLPLTTFNWTLAAVVLGGLLTGVWLWMPGSPLGNSGGLIALAALGTAVFCFVFKYFTEDAAAEKLESCQRQMDTLARQIEEAEKEKKRLDAELPMTDGSVALRLQAAERHLAELEKVLPVEVQRKQAGHEVSTAESRVAQARQQLEKAMSAWRNKLVGLGFSEKIDPQRFLNVCERFTALSDLEGRAKLRRDDLELRQREHAMITRRITDLAQETGCVLESDEVEIGDDGDEYEVEVNIVDQLEHLLAERHKQLSAVERRQQLLERAKQLKAEEGKHRQAIVGANRRREALFQAADCDNEAAYRRLAEDQLQIAAIRKQRDDISREISAAIGRHASEENFAELLSPEQLAQLDALWETASERLETCQGELKTLVGRRGELRQQQKSLAEDRSLAERQLELSCTETQLADARRSWREHATVNRVLERIRTDYESHRQPETLEEASRTMAKLTGGEYRRVWTPLGDDVLLVENSAGESLSVNLLSRGTREQLFLSVRLALVANFARRGVRLPMVLDDVLVNFDIVRAQRAAEVLCEFAAGGHQLLVFTCHEHIWQMFQQLDADCRRLPVRGAKASPKPVEIAPEPLEVAAPKVIVEPKPKAPLPKPKKRRKPQPAPVEVRTEVLEPEPEDFYEYPFVEEIKQEEVVTQVPVATEPLAVESPLVAETPYDWSSHSVHLQRSGSRKEPGVSRLDATEENALAYILPEENTSVRQSRADHLVQRRA
ncbi:MAG: AAA family ATPase [Planctomycetales bacterium]|nr:AAA family ATPase [Planctomycetales bacterium]